jgi:protein-L-isoaspartate(D-aspartate) O-methyltransferase
VHTTDLFRAVADGRLGYSAEAPYDAIHVGAACETLPQHVSSQIHLIAKSVLMNAYAAD